MRYVIEYRREYSDLWQVSGNYVSSELERQLGYRPRLQEVEFPSLEDAMREAMHQQSTSMSNLPYRARDTQPEPAQEGPTRDYWSEWTWRGDHMEEVAQGRVVRIYRRSGRWVIDSAGRDRPVMSALAPYLPQGARATARGTYHVEDALNHGMNPQMLAGALSAYFTEHPNASGQIRIEEGRSDLPDNMAYLAFGDFVYRMVPVRQVSSGRAMKAMREKLAREMRTLRTGLEQQAGVEARSIVRRAQEQAARIQSEIAKLQEEASSSYKFPPWTLGYPVKSNDSRQWVCREVAIAMTRCIHGSHVWPISPTINVKVDLWLPVDHNESSVHMQNIRQGYLPHISGSMACMTLGEKVKDIKDRDCLDIFAGQVARAMGTINLASLLNNNINGWLKEIQEGIPETIRVWLRAVRGDSGAQQTGAGLSLAPATERPEETWTTR